MYRFKCDGQELRLVANDEAASGYFNTVYAHFELCDRWAGMVVVAQYTQEQDGAEKTYNELVSEETGLAVVSNSLISGAVAVSIFGVSPSTGARLTSTPVEIYVNKSGFASTDETPIPPDADLYAQLVAQVKRAADIDDDATSDVTLWSSQKTQAALDNKVDKDQGAGNAGLFLGIDETGAVVPMMGGGSGGTAFRTDDTLKLENGVLSVNCAEVMEEDNSLPITSGAVYTEVGNINALLGTI